MVKTNGTFNLSKTTKRMLAGMSGAKKTHWKKMMIDAEVSFAKAKLARPAKVKSE
jgi:hypothetical protein